MSSPGQSISHTDYVFFGFTHHSSHLNEIVFSCCASKETFFGLSKNVAIFIQLSSHLLYNINSTQSNSYLILYYIAEKIFMKPKFLFLIFFIFWFWFNTNFLIGSLKKYWWLLSIYFIPKQNYMSLQNFKLVKKMTH